MQAADTGTPDPGLTSFPSTDPVAPVRGAGRPDSTWVLLALTVSLIGFVGVAGLLYEFRFHDVTVSLAGFPARVVFVLSVAAAAAPFAVTVWRRVPPMFLLPPLLLIFFLYPLFAPYGFVYNRDSVYVYQFGRALLDSGTWVPAAGVTQQAIVYSYYPGIAVYIAEFASISDLALAPSILWSTELVRFVLLPPMIYLVTARLFSRRAAPLAVLLYAVEPSIEMNVPTQQDFAVVFFVLALVLFALLATQASRSPFLRASLLMASAMVILSHHVSTYLLVGTLAMLALLPLVLWRETPYPEVHPKRVFARTFVLAVAWGFLVAAPVVLLQERTLVSNVAAVLHPSRSAGILPGASFPAYELAWLGLAVLLEAGIALSAVRSMRRAGVRSLVVTEVLLVIVVAVLSLPFLSTGFSFLALRESEYLGVVLAPLCAWWIVHRLAGRAPTTPKVSEGRAVRDPRTPSIWGLDTTTVRERRGSRVVAIGAIVLLVSAGMLVPLSTRDQFAASSAYQSDSPMYVTPAALAAAHWAAANLSRSHDFWGDFLTYTVFGGFGDFAVHWDSYELFRGTNFSGAAGQLQVGDYVAVDPQMTRSLSSPMFWGPDSDQPTTVLAPAELAKFQNSEYFSPVFANTAFTIYVTVEIPAGG